MAKRRRQRPATERPSSSAGDGGAGSRKPQSQAPARPSRAAGSGSPARSSRARPAAQPRGLLSGADPWRIGIIGAVILGIVVVVAAVVAGGGGSGRYTCGQLLAPGGSPEDGQVTANLGRGHVATGTQLSYLFCPPTWGSHYSVAGVAPARAGFYGPDADIGPGSWVHNLEHGYVVALYRCQDGVCPSEEVLAELRRLVNNGPQTQSAQTCGIRSKVIAARFDDMATPFALLTWDRALLLDTFDADEAIGFAQRWMEKAAPEAGSC